MVIFQKKVCFSGMLGKKKFASRVIFWPPHKYQMAAPLAYQNIAISTYRKKVNIKSTRYFTNDIPTILDIKTLDLVHPCGVTSEISPDLKSTPTKFCSLKSTLLHSAC